MRIFDKELIVKKDRVIMKEIKEQNIVIPSPMFPLNGPYQIFHSENTEEIDPNTEEGKRCFKAFDALIPEMGHTYDNMEQLLRVFRRRGIPVKSYVGWMFMDADTPPLHHCFAVYDGNKVLDPDILIPLRLMDADREDDENQIRRLYEKNRKVPNHEKFTCGKVGEVYFYVASEGEPMEGRKIIRELLKRYPDHILY